MPQQPEVIKKGLYTAKPLELDANIDLKDMVRQLGAHGSTSRIMPAPKLVQDAYQLAIALKDYQGDIHKKSDDARSEMVFRLLDLVSSYLIQTAPGLLIQKAPGLRVDKDAVLEQFKTQCAKDINTYYKDIACEPSLWNAVKEFFKPLLNCLGISVTLDATAFIKTKAIKEKLDAIKQPSDDKLGIVIEGEKDIDFGTQPKTS